MKKDLTLRLNSVQANNDFLRKDNESLSEILQQEREIRYNEQIKDEVSKLCMKAYYTSLLQEREPTPQNDKTLQH